MFVQLYLPLLKENHTCMDPIERTIAIDNYEKMTGKGDLRLI